MKKLVAFIALFLCFGVNGFAYNIGVYDDADLFTSVEEESINEEENIFAQRTGFSLAVVTTDFTSGLPSEEYADDFLENLIDTEGWQENSILFLIDMDNRNVWISTTGDCQLAFSDSEIDSIIDGGYNELTYGYYFDSVVAMIRCAAATDTVIDENNDFYIVDDESYFEDDNFNGNIIQYDGDYYQIDSDGNWEIIKDFDYDNGYSAPGQGFGFTDFLFYLAVGLAVGAITVFIVKSRYKNQGRGDEFGSEDIVLNLTASNDNIISRNVITTKVPRNNNHHHRGGGISGGGSSVHRSSGGRSHGGGGRSF